ncbi:MAG: hypothetical protein CMO12_01230 [Thaumarchaeota archaeon]|nr:hypothetical protein [Nitrososphaerota archaeon]
MTEAKLLVQGIPPEPLDRPFTVIGHSISRIDGVEKVSGTAEYAGDIQLPNMLCAKILRCPHAHARILKIDTSKAEALPGVKAVISRNNFPDWLTYWYLIPQFAFPEIVSYVGQEVAAVAAVDIDTAERALKLIEVDYQELPAVFDPEEALKPTSQKVTPLDVPDSTCPRAPAAWPVGNLYEGKTDIHTRGDIAKGFQDADVVIEEVYNTSYQFHATLQTRSSVIDWDGENMTVHDSCQGVWQVSQDIAKSLGLPMEKVRVVVKYQGGGFGSKAGAQRYLHYASRLAMMAGRPVRIELTRPEEFISHPHRHATKTYLKMGVKRDGTLTAMEGRSILNLGVGSTYGNQKEKLIETAFELYECPNVKLEQVAVYTNTPLTGYMRSVMRAIGDFFLEAHMDRLAVEIGMDPLDLRMKNYAVFGDQVKKLPYSAKNLDKCMKISTDAIDWKHRDRFVEDNKNGPIKRGIGMASYMYDGVGMAPFKASADVVIKRNGTVEVLAGVVDIGGGQATMMAMLAAEELGVNVNNVKTVWGDTGPTQFAPGTHASRMTAEMGPAVVQAAANARKKLFELTAQRLSAEPIELRSALGKIQVSRDQQRSMSFEEACQLIPDGEEIKASGSRKPNPKDIVFHTFGSQACEVEVNTDTGAVRVLRVASAHELGKVLNPKLVDSQHYGGIIMGIGYTLLEDPEFDSKTGIMLNPDLHQYRIPTSLEVPEILPFNIEAPDPFFAYSAKAVGEAPIVPVAPSVRNAIYHAAGIWINSLPITPDAVLKALGKSK